jgi:hypothetical protein
MELMNIKTAFSYLKTFYGIDVKESDFEEIALNAWELIGTKHTELKQYIGDSYNGILELPCDCVDIETVSLPIIDANTTGTLTDGFDGTAVATELYIEFKPGFSDPRYTGEKFLKYKYSGNKLQFDKDYTNILVVYHGVLMDDNDLPLINDKEMRAIASYVAYATTYKEGLMKKDGNIINLANTMKADWLRACNAARVSDHLTQNDMDAILDVKYSSDRKRYGKSYKPIK